jgi:hypothetical protein
MHMAVSQPRQLATDFSTQRPGFNPRAVHVGYMVNKAAFKQVFSEYFIFPLSIITLLVLHIHAFIIWGWYRWTITNHSAK